MHWYNKRSQIGNKTIQSHLTRPQEKKGTVILTRDLALVLILPVDMMKFNILTNENHAFILLPMKSCELENADASLKPVFWSDVGWGGAE